eukprot:9314633-Alexandrium_andersonii.AAC.1
MPSCGPWLSIHSAVLTLLARWPGPSARGAGRAIGAVAPQGGVCQWLGRLGQPPCEAKERPGGRAGRP